MAVEEQGQGKRAGGRWEVVVGQIGTSVSHVRQWIVPSSHWVQVGEAISYETAEKVKSSQVKGGVDVGERIWTVLDQSKERHLDNT
jgi:hypothetical protein